MSDTWQDLIQAAWQDFEEIGSSVDGTPFRIFLLRAVRGQSLPEVDLELYPEDVALAHAWTQVVCALQLGFFLAWSGFDLTFLVRTGKGSCSLLRGGPLFLARS